MLSGGKERVYWKQMMLINTSLLVILLNTNQTRTNIIVPAAHR